MNEKIIGIFNSDEVDVLSEFIKEDLEIAKELPIQLTVDKERMGEVSNE